MLGVLLVTIKLFAGAVIAFLGVGHDALGFGNFLGAFHAAGDPGSARDYSCTDQQKR
ncbi:hypothetical protein D3C76_1620230 [compost metagenome]